jgi:hypothetical protein
MGQFTDLRTMAYLRRIAIALEKIAEFTDVQAQAMPRRSRRGTNPSAEILRPSVKDWNTAYRERTADINAAGEQGEEL